MSNLIKYADKCMNTLNFMTKYMLDETASYEEWFIYNGKIIKDIGNITLHAIMNQQRIELPGKDLDTKKRDTDLSMPLKILLI